MDDLHSLTIGQKRIADDTDAYIVAEIGNNHCGDLRKAFELIRKAKEAGADAVKTQTRNNQEIYTKALFESPYDHENSYGKTYGKHREALELRRSDYKELFYYAAELRIDFFSTAFDEKSVDLLMEFNPPAFKISSGDITNLPLLNHVAMTRRPIILSTGAATMGDILKAIDVITNWHEEIAILQCTAAYPCAFEELDLRVIETYRKNFPYCIGLSSHDNGIAMGPVAYALGARIFEKHFTLNHTWKGTDHAFSLEPPGLTKFIRDIRRVKVALGNGVKKQYESEEKGILKMRKSLYAACDIQKGEILTPFNIARKSPANGIPVSEIGKFIGRTVNQFIPAETHLQFEHLEVEP